MKTMNTETTAKRGPAGRARGLLLGSALTASALAAVSATAQEITVLTGYPELEPFYEHVAEGMSAEYPDLVVNIEPISLREHERRVALGLTGGLDDGTVIEFASAGAQRFLEAGLLPAAPEDVAAYVQENFGEFFVDGVSYDGQIYGIPLFRGQSALYYNTEMFEAAGLDGPPTTMEEFTEYADVLTQRDDAGNPTVSGWSLRLSGGGQGIAEKFWINLHQFGGTVLEQTEDGMWRAAYASPEGVAALSQYLDNLYVYNTVTSEMPADAEAFEREQTAMFIRESWVIGDIAQNAPDLPYATSVLPTGSIALSQNLYVMGDGEAADAAWAFAQATTTEDNMIWLLENVGWLPNRSGLDYASVIETTPALDAFVTYPDDYAFFTLPAIGPIAEILTRLADQLTTAYADESLAGDDAAIMALLEEAAEETNEILDREGLLAE
ncbi:extracellular solute-binding protein [Rhodobacterales bacterium HKCCE2091]|nr:extracellular solute-binding protein [Rhodobacterales bacterium HKCCE2091]